MGLIRKLRYFSNITFIFLIISVSCAGGRSSIDPSASEGEGEKCEGRMKRCKLEACHIRRIHQHEGACFKGKKKWFLKRLFFFNKDPRVGQGYKKQRRDRHQHPH